MDLHHIRLGQGPPLLLLHGLGGSVRSWSTITQALGAKRELVIPDLPGHGLTPLLHGETSIATFADAVTGFLERHGLIGVDAVGSSMGARLVLELARRRAVGSVVSLDPGGFWRGWERAFFATTIGASGHLLRAIKPALPVLMGNAMTRSALLVQFSAKPRAIAPAVALTELESMAQAPAFGPLLHSLVHGPAQQGIPAGQAPGAITIGWGRNDRVCLPRQAARAQRLFPDAELHWFDNCGHLPHWDQPRETTQLILDRTG